MKASKYLHWAGWSILVSLVAMILSVVLLMLAVRSGSIIPGTHTHSVIVETFDVLTTAFLLPLPLAYYLIYKTYSPRLAYQSALVGTVTLLAATIVNILFVFEVLWFSDAIGGYLYGVSGIGLVAWLVMIAILAHRSRKPAHGFVINIIGATIIGIPIWAFSTGYLLAAGKLTDRPA